MPLTELQAAILRVLAGLRAADSYVAGATPLNRDAARYSSDIDIFHDRAEQVAVAARRDVAALKAAGFAITWLRQEPAIQAATISRGGPATRLEWVADSDFRFFPVIPDAVFGFVLHPVDLALNKVMAAAGRREVRDLVDLVTVHARILPLGAACWAAVEKSPGYTPEGLIAEIRRNAHYPRSAWAALSASAPVDPVATWGRLNAALDEAAAFVASMPSTAAGRLFLQGGNAVQPDVTQLSAYVTHAGAPGGHWPSGPEIERAMWTRAVDDSPDSGAKEDNS